MFRLRIGCCVLLLMAFLGCGYRLPHDVDRAIKALDVHEDGRVLLAVIGYEEGAQVTDIYLSSLNNLYQREVLARYRGLVDCADFVGDNSIVIGNRRFDQPSTIELRDIATNTSIAQHVVRDISVIRQASSSARVAFALNAKTVAIMDGRDGRLLHKVDTALIEPSAFAFSEDDRQLAVGDDEGKVILIDVASGAARELIDLKGGEITCLGFVRRDTALALCHAWHGCRIHDLANGKLLKKFDMNDYGIWSLAVSARGNRLVFEAYDELWWIDATTLELVRRSPMGTRKPNWCLAFSQDGATLLSGGMDGVFQAWNVASGKETLRIDLVTDRR